IGTGTPDLIGTLLIALGVGTLVALCLTIPVILRGVNWRFRRSSLPSSKFPPENLEDRGQRPGQAQVAAEHNRLLSLSAPASIACAGDIVPLVGLRHNLFIIALQEGMKFDAHRGVLLHDDLIGRQWGPQVFSHMGAPFFLLQPARADLLTDLPRATQT